MATGPELPNDYYRNMRLSMFGIASEVSTGTSSSGAVTVNDYFCLVTTEALTTAQNAKFTLTVTNNKIAVGDLVFASVGNGTNTQGTPMLETVTVAASTATIIVVNKHASAEAFNGTLKIAVMVIKAL